MMSMLINWKDRSAISSNLLNPAFCGEILRRTIWAYNQNDEEEKIPFSLLYLILPIILHKATREKMPLRTNTYFHSWVNSNEYLFIDFAKRTKQLKPYTSESLMFLLKNNAVVLNDDGNFVIKEPYRKKNPRGNSVDEVKMILRKAEMLGKWLRLTGNPQTVYMFLKIKP